MQMIAASNSTHETVQDVQSTTRQYTPVVCHPATTVSSTSTPRFHRFGGLSCIRLCGIGESVPLASSVDSPLDWTARWEGG